MRIGKDRDRPPEETWSRTEEKKEKAAGRGLLGSLEGLVQTSGVLLRHVQKETTIGWARTTTPKGEELTVLVLT